MQQSVNEKISQILGMLNTRKLRGGTLLAVEVKGNIEIYPYASTQPLPAELNDIPAANKTTIHVRISSSAQNTYPVAFNVDYQIASLFALAKQQHPSLNDEEINRAKAALKNVLSADVEEVLKLQSTDNKKFHQAYARLIKKTQRLTLKVLEEQLRAAGAVDPKKILKEVRKAAVDQRDESSTLTISVAPESESDPSSSRDSMISTQPPEPKWLVSHATGTQTTAHARKLNDGLGNAYTETVGIYDPAKEEFEVIDVNFSHSSMVPTDDLHTPAVVPGFAAGINPEILAKTIANYIEKLKIEASNQGLKEGDTLYSQYTLLTSTNKTNTDEQLLSYRYLMLAVRMLDQQKLRLDDGSLVTLNLGLFNGPINKFAGISTGAEVVLNNKYAYEKLNQALKKLTEGAGSAEDADQDLRKLIFPKKSTAKDTVADVDAEGSTVFVVPADAATALADEENSSTAGLSEFMQLFTDKSRNDIATNGEFKNHYDNVERQRLAYIGTHAQLDKGTFEESREDISAKIKNLLAQAQVSGQKISPKTAALICKFYADEIYYDTNFLQRKSHNPVHLAQLHEQILLFNTYKICAELLSGMAVSYACKSGNDRRSLQDLLVQAVLIKFNHDGKIISPEALIAEKGSIDHDNLMQIIQSLHGNLASELNALKDTGVPPKNEYGARISYFKAELAKPWRGLNKLGKQAFHKLTPKKASKAKAALAAIGLTGAGGAAAYAIYSGAAAQALTFISSGAATQALLTGFTSLSALGVAAIAAGVAASGILAFVAYKLGTALATKIAPSSKLAPKIVKMIAALLFVGSSAALATLLTLGTLAFLSTGVGAVAVGIGLGGLATLALAKFIVNKLRASYEKYQFNREIKQLHGEVNSILGDSSRLVNVVQPLATIEVPNAPDGPNSQSSTDFPISTGPSEGAEVSADANADPAHEYSLYDDPQSSNRKKVDALDGADSDDKDPFLGYEPLPSGIFINPPQVGEGSLNKKPDPDAPLRLFAAFRNRELAGARQEEDVLNKTVQPTTPKP